MLVMKKDQITACHFKINLLCLCFLSYSNINKYNHTKTHCSNLLLDSFHNNNIICRVNLINAYPHSPCSLADNRSPIHVPLHTLNMYYIKILFLTKGQGHLK